MRYLAGETLADRLKTAGRLEESEAVRIASQIASGLDAIHRAGIFHRDLKCSNIMLVSCNGEARPIVMDFGLAGRIEPDGFTIPGQAMGTLAYMAPELMAGEKASTASDVYSFGVIFREMIAGRRGSGAPETVQRWQRLIARCLDPDPRRRATLTGRGRDAADIFAQGALSDRQGRGGRGDCGDCGDCCSVPFLCDSSLIQDEWPKQRFDCLLRGHEQRYAGRAA
jgi:serine/threonine protein kinase